MWRRITGLSLIVILCAFLMFYMQHGYLQSREIPTNTTTEDATVEGFESPEEMMAYYLYRIQDKDLDGALRACAIGELSEYYNLTEQLKYKDKLRPEKMLPPCETDNSAYKEITRNIMANHYLELYDQCIFRLIDGHEFELLKVWQDVPENPDGKYYTFRDQVCTILGCREVAEVKSLVKVDGLAYELEFTLARYKHYWKILVPNELALSDETDMHRIRQADYDGEEPSDIYSEVKSQILPKNYYIIETVREEDAAELVDHMMIYLQRGDVYSAMSYFTIPKDPGTDTANRKAIVKQATIAEGFKNLYYTMFLHDEDYLKWMKRHLQDYPETFAETVNMENMSSVNVTSIKMTKKISEKQANYRVYYHYDGIRFKSRFRLTKNKDGWAVKKFLKTS